MLSQENPAESLQKSCRNNSQGGAPPSDSSESARSFFCGQNNVNFGPIKKMKQLDELYLPVGVPDLENNKKTPKMIQQLIFV